MSGAPDITVMLSTYNRSGILRETLECFTRLDVRDLRVEFVVIDNNSGDDTRETAESFADRLPLRVLFCGTPGKNAALNLGLRQANLGAIIVMTDDDVSPRQDWLLAIHAASARWPDAAVFGGAVQVVWPDVNVPGWAKHEFIRSFGFAHHEYADRDTPYTNGQFPHGPNYWIRREVIEAGHCFDERIGPRPKNRILGDETVFLKQLNDAGYKLMYT
ncbi:MAG: glycosyltransferase, partial [Planctomycetota bacterium]